MTVLANSLIDTSVARKIIPEDDSKVYTFLSFLAMFSLVGGEHKHPIVQPTVESRIPSLKGCTCNMI